MNKILQLVRAVAIASILGFAGDRLEAAEPEEPTALADTPAVAAIREANPSTPEELLRAVSLLIPLERMDLAQDYLQRLADLNLDDEAKAQLHAQFGSGLLIRLARQKELAPLGSEFALSVLGAARRQATDPQRLARLVEQLGDASGDSRFPAAAELIQAGSHAVPPLVIALAAADDPVPIERSAAAIVADLGDEAVPPLSAFLSSPEVRQRAVAISLLGYTKSTRAIPYLVRPYFAPDPQGIELQAATAAWPRVAGQLPQRGAALQILREAADRAYTGEVPAAVDRQGELEWWTWNAEAQRAVAHRLQGRDVAAIVAARHLDDLLDLPPTATPDRRKALIARLHIDQALGGLNRPLRRGIGTAYQRAYDAGPDEVQAVLAEALRDGYPSAAMGAAEVLGELGDRRVLAGSPEQLAPLVAALHDPHRRVRLAAAAAIAQLQPEAPFAGISRWVQVLARTAAVEGKRLVLVAHPRRAAARTLGGMLTDAGYQTITAANGTELIRHAVNSSDVELVMISDRLNPESLWSWLEELRVDPFTAELPVVIVATARTLPTAERVAAAHSRVIVVLESVDAEAMLTRLPTLLAFAGRERVDPDERLRNARFARETLQQLDEARFDLDEESRQVLRALLDPIEASGRTDFGTSKPQP